MEKTIRFGIIGAGRISRRTAKAMLKMKEEGIVLKAVASRDAAKAEAFAAELAGRDAEPAALRCYGSYEELAADPDIDAVYIGLINSSHAPAARLCLEHGKAVLCEKPFFIHAEDVRDCMELARQKDLLIMEAMWTRRRAGSGDRSMCVRSSAPGFRISCAIRRAVCSIRILAAAFSGTAASIPMNM